MRASKVDAPPKRCEKCGIEYEKKPTESIPYWAAKRFCGRSCSEQSKKYPIRKKKIKVPLKAINTALLFGVIQ